jgi:SAM-dependent methyltransferase
LRETLAALFLFGELVDASALGEMSPPELDAFMTVDLVRGWPSAEGRRLYSPVRLVPLDGGPFRRRDLLLAGDRGDHPDGSPFAPFADIVFSGHNPLTRQFLRLLPNRHCGDLLDLCSGTGVGALMQADLAERSTGVDVAERSVHFARFNAWLNDCPALELFTGDLYRPVAGRRFDRIIAHPPYVPALTQKLTYRDGGQTGEEIVRGIVAGVPDHLAEGGTFHLLFLGMDTDDGAIEQRARRWLGPAGDEFDIIYALDSRTPPELIATRLVDRAGGSPQDLARWRDLFQGIRVQDFVYGALVGRRVPEAGRTQTFTRRVLLGEATTGASFDRLFAWFDRLRAPDLEGRVLASAPTLSPDIHLEVRHAVQDGTFVPEGYALSNAGEPFYAVVKTDPWVAALLSELDGTTTVLEHHRRATSRQRLPQGFTASDLARLMCFLAERGYVVI